MSEKRSFGLKSVKMGPPEADGGMCLTPTLLGDGATLEGTASFTKEEDTEKPIYSEESDDPIEIIQKKGLSVLEFAIADLTAATMVRVLGGTDTAGKWEAPDVAPDIEQSFEVTTQRDVVIKIPRAKVKARVEWPLTKEDLGRIVIKATVLKPKKAGEKSFTVQ